MPTWNQVKPLSKKIASYLYGSQFIFKAITGMKKAYNKYN